VFSILVLCLIKGQAKIIKESQIYFCFHQKADTNHISISFDSYISIFLFDPLFHSFREEESEVVTGEDFVTEVLLTVDHHRLMTIVADHQEEGEVSLFSRECIDLNILDVQILEHFL
jgi:hypothetical protein